MYLHITAYDVNGNVITSKSIEDAELNTHYPVRGVFGASHIVVLARELDEDGNAKPAEREVSDAKDNN